MVVIRLARVGSKHNPMYRVTVANSKSSLGGKFIEVIGSYNPSPSGQAKELNLDLDKVNTWISKGAQPTLRVKSLIKKAQAQPKA